MSQVERAKKQNCILPLLASILVEKQVYCNCLTTFSAFQSLLSPSVDDYCSSRPQCHSSLEKEWSGGQILRDSVWFYHPLIYCFIFDNWPKLLLSCGSDVNMMHLIEYLWHQEFTLLEFNSLCQSRNTAYLYTKSKVQVPLKHIVNNKNQIHFEKCFKVQNVSNYHHCNGLHGQKFH